MATYIEKIHGFVLEGTRFSTETNRFVLKEIVKVEAKHVNVTLAQVVSELPSFLSGPGTADFNPQQLTFTLNQSPHPDTSYYYLSSTESAGREKDTCFWLFPVTYQTQDPFADVEIKKRKDQKVKKPDSSTDADKEQITNPVDRPAVWSGNTKIVPRPSFFDLDGEIIRHTNYAPISKEVNLNVSHRNWSWTFNVDAKTWTLNPFKVMENKVNSVAIDIPIGAGFYTGGPPPTGTSGTVEQIEAEKMWCKGFTFTEHWETPSGSTTEYHYVTVKADFEISPDPWTTPPLSLHTKEWRYTSPGKSGLVPIRINERGDTAVEPWPLKPNGLAFTAAELESAVKTDFGVLQSGDPPSMADLEVVETYDFTSFFRTYELALPRNMN